MPKIVLGLMPPTTWRPSSAVTTGEVRGVGDADEPGVDGENPHRQAHVPGHHGRLDPALGAEALTGRLAGDLAAFGQCH